MSSCQIKPASTCLTTYRQPVARQQCVPRPQQQGLSSACELADCRENCQPERRKCATIGPQEIYFSDVANQAYAFDPAATITGHEYSVALLASNINDGRSYSPGELTVSVIEIAATAAYAVRVRVFSSQNWPCGVKFNGANVVVDYNRVVTAQAPNERLAGQIAAVSDTVSEHVLAFIISIPNAYGDDTVQANAQLFANAITAVTIYLSGAYCNPCVSICN